jgi:3-methyladenine DNA glycosylase AlkD
MESFVKTLATKLASVANEEKAVGMQAYMKNQFAFLGIQSPQRRKVCKEHIRQNKLEDGKQLETIVKELWNLQEREFQYCAIELLAFYKKLWEKAIIDLFEFCITTKSWWDTVDFIATECTGPYFKIFPGQIVHVTSQWNSSENIWLQRSSLLFQKGYKKDTDTKLLSAYIKNLSFSKEFFVQKAIGWMLREYAKTNPEWVKKFVDSNLLAPLSKREALKHFAKQ